MFSGSRALHRISSDHLFTSICLAYGKIKMRANAILIIGAGELRMAVIRALSERGSANGGALSVLLRPETDDAPNQPAAVLRDMGVNIVRAAIWRRQRKKPCRNLCGLSDGHLLHRFRRLDVFGDPGARARQKFRHSGLRSVPVGISINIPIVT
jgi:hypothetical protein